ncbi:MAG: ABC transporter permease [Acidobacteriaceae bacterium]|nr:ABC transporter permease [Acidobacteriaceae bacterium]
MYRCEHSDLQCRGRRAASSAAVPGTGSPRLIVTAVHRSGREGVNQNQTGAQFEALRDGTPALDVAAFSGAGAANFTSAGIARYVSQQRVSAGFSQVLGIAPQAGREFTPGEDHAGGPAVVILSYDFWQSAFAAPRRSSATQSTCEASRTPS